MQSVVLRMIRKFPLHNIKSQMSACHFDIDSHPIHSSQLFAETILGSAEVQEEEDKKDSNSRKRKVQI
jgi:hypothetical protein